MIRRKTAAYKVFENRLWRDDEELIAGPLHQLEHFAAVMNHAKPEEPDIAPLLRILIRTTRDCSFAVGPRLLADGTPIRLVTRQKVPKPKRTAVREPAE